MNFSMIGEMPKKSRYTAKTKTNRNIGRSFILDMSLVKMKAEKTKRPAKKEIIPPLESVKKSAIAMAMPRKAYITFFSTRLDMSVRPRERGMIIPIKPAK